MQSQKCSFLWGWINGVFESWSFSPYVEQSLACQDPPRSLVASAEGSKMLHRLLESFLSLIYGCVCCAKIINLHTPPPGHFTSGIYWPKTICVKKCFEILPDNHYGIFEKTRCPRVNEICKSLILLLGQIPSLSTIPLPFVLFCFHRRGRFFIRVSLPSHHGFTERRLERGIIKDISLRVQKSFDSFEQELLAKCISEAFRWQKHLEESCDM